MDRSMQLAEQSFLTLPEQIYYVCPSCGNELGYDDRIYINQAGEIIGCYRCVSEDCAGDYLPYCKS